MRCGRWRGERQSEALACPEIALGFGPDDIATTVSAFRKICQIEVPDGILFDPSGLSDAFVQDAEKQKQWVAFLKKNRLEALDLAEVVALLRGEFQKLRP